MEESILDVFSPGGHQAGGDRARALLGCCSCSTPSLEAPAGIMTAQWSGGFCQLYFLWLAVSPSQGNNLEAQQLLGQGPATEKDEGSLNHGNVGWKEFLEVKAELLFPMGGAIPEATCRATFPIGHMKSCLCYGCYEHMDNSMETIPG